MKRIFLLLLFFVGVAGILVAGAWSTAIKEVECWFDDQPLEKEVPVCDQLQTLVGSRLLFRDFYRDQTTTQLLYVGQTEEIYDLQRVQKSLSGKIIFSLTDRPPLYRMERNGEVVLIAVTGGVRENNPQLQVPLVVDKQGIYQQPATHQFLAEFLGAFEDEPVVITEIVLVSPERVEMTIANFPLVVVELQQNPQQAAGQLTTILRELRPQQIDVSLKELDLRFELPVLRTYTSSDSSQAVIDS